MSAHTLHVKSKIAGKNADVFVYPDRIEYGKSGFISADTRERLAKKSYGASMLLTGFKSKDDKTILPMKAISTINSRRDGMLNTVVTFATSTGDIEVRCSNADAKQLVATVQQHMLG